MGTRFRSKLLIISCSLIMVVAARYPVSADSIVGSKHDFSMTNASGDRQFAGQYKTGGFFGMAIDEICVFCHTPHGASQDLETSTLLWNRINPQGSLTYKTYSSSTTTLVAPDGTGKPTGISLMCMSCHDGVTSLAVNTLLNAPGSGNPAVTVETGMTNPGAMGNIYMGTGFLGWGPNIGNAVPGGSSIDLSNDHPISFNYPSPNANIKMPTDPGLRLFGAGNRLECATCHRVHDNAIPPFLSMDNTQSLMCRDCHIK